MYLSKREFEICTLQMHQAEREYEDLSVSIRAMNWIIKMAEAFRHDPAEQRYQEELVRTWWMPKLESLERSREFARERWCEYEMRLRLHMDFVIQYRESGNSNVITGLGDLEQQSLF